MEIQQAEYSMNARNAKTDPAVTNGTRRSPNNATASTITEENTS
jgi:hypothetical protein